MSDGSSTPPRHGIKGGGSARRKPLAWTKYNLEQGLRWDDIPDPVLTCNFGARVHRRKSLIKTEYTQDLLTYPSRPLSQSVWEVIRLVPRRTGIANSSSSTGPFRAVCSGFPGKASQVTQFLGRICFREQLCRLKQHLRRSILNSEINRSVNF